MRASATAADTIFPLVGLKIAADSDTQIPYSREALAQDLLRVRVLGRIARSSRDRNAIYGYLSAVFDLVMWWTADDRAISRARRALQLQVLDLPTTDEPFAAVIFCTADRQKVDKRTRSKWSRVLRYAAEYKTNRRTACRVSFSARAASTNVPARFTRCLGRRSEK